MDQYYIRILKIEKNNFLVQWIDGSKGWTKEVHPHMITEYNQWRNTHKKIERPKMPMIEVEICQKDINQMTRVCGKDGFEKEDDLNNPIIRGKAIGIWCEQCKKWYANNCLSKKDIDLSQEISQYLPCYKIHFPMKPEESESKEQKEPTEDEINEKLKKIHDKFEIEYLDEKNNEKKENLLGLLKISTPGEWLNETIINSLAEKLRSSKTYVINSLQAELIVQEKNSVNRMRIKEAAKIKSKKDIKTIIIPFSMGEHWMGFLIDLRDPNSMNVWSFDSFGSKHNFHAPLKKYIIELLDLDTDIHVSVHKFPIKHYQNDEHSCGVYLAGWFQFLRGRLDIDPKNLIYTHTKNPNASRLQIIEKILM